MTTTITIITIVVVVIIISGSNSDNLTAVRIVIKKTQLHVNYIFWTDKPKLVFMHNKQALIFFTLWNTATKKKKRKKNNQLIKINADVQRRRRRLWHHFAKKLLNFFASRRLLQKGGKAEAKKKKSNFLDCKQLYLITKKLALFSYFVYVWKKQKINKHINKGQGKRQHPNEHSLGTDCALTYCFIHKYIYLPESGTSNEIIYLKNRFILVNLENFISEITLMNVLNLYRTVGQIWIFF